MHFVVPGVVLLVAFGRTGSTLNENDALGHRRRLSL
jgi:hypothetical protein